MPTIEDIITTILKQEGPETNDPTDKGGRTAFGISEKSNPEAWLDNKVTEEEARAIYHKKYVKWPRFDKIKHGPLQAQLIDFGVNSGPQRAIIALQTILGTEQDGLLGPETLTALAASDVSKTNNKLVIERIKMFCNIVVRNPSQLKFLRGWINRGFEFLIY